MGTLKFLVRFFVSRIKTMTKMTEYVILFSHKVFTLNGVNVISHN